MNGGPVVAICYGAELAVDFEMVLARPCDEIRRPMLRSARLLIEESDQPIDLGIEIVIYDLIGCPMRRLGSRANARSTALYVRRAPTGHRGPPRPGERH